MSAEAQERLTRVGPGTPMGALLRRYWHPIAGSSEISPGGAIATRILGEDLVIFRGADGTVGVLHRRCRHRGTALEHGVVDDDGIRCPYHGWRFARDGACTEIPTEEPGSPVLARARTTAYPARELGGLVWAYLGPAPAPILPRWDLLTWEGVLRDIGRAVIPCNWLQIMENSVDPTHVEWLHGHHLAAVCERAGTPPPTKYRKRHVEVGFDRFEWGIIKRRVLEGGSREDDDWRVGHPLVFPLTLRVGARGQHRLQIRVPVDDTHTLHFWLACYLPPPGQVARQQLTVPVYEVPFQDAAGRPIADFVDGGDIMTWVGQGPIADRTRELLVGTDRGLVLYRRMLREQLDQVAAGYDPLGVRRNPADDVVIELPQEDNKFGDGGTFLAESLRLGHARYSPLRDEILAWYGEVAP